MPCGPTLTVHLTSSPWVGSVIFKTIPGPFDFQSRIKIFESDTAIKTVSGYFESGTYRLSSEDFPRESLLWAGDSVMDKVVPDPVLLEQTTLRGRQESWSTPDKAHEGKRAAVLVVGRRLWSEGGRPGGVHLSGDSEPRQLAGSGWREPVVGGESRGQGIPWGNSQGEGLGRIQSGREDRALKDRERGDRGEWLGWGGSRAGGFSAPLSL